MNRGELSKTELVELGMNSASSDMYDEDMIWSQHSGDKADIAREMMVVIRLLNKSLPLSRKLRALSIGSGAEPQLKILDAAFQGKINLLDIDSVPLDKAKTIARQHLTGIPATIQADFTKHLLDPLSTVKFLKGSLGDKRQDMVTLHHSLYYCDKKDWGRLFENICKNILSQKGSIHAVLMASKSRNPSTTTWLYNHFAGKFFNSVNDQDLSLFGRELQKNISLKNIEIVRKTSKVKFWIDDFEKLMAVIWMILLYPNVHNYRAEQKQEITEHIYENYWAPGKPLIQMQDHLIVYKNLEQ